MLFPHTTYIWPAFRASFRDPLAFFIELVTDVSTLLGYGATFDENQIWRFAWLEPSRVMAQNLREVSMIWETDLSHPWLGIPSGLHIAPTFLSLR